MVAGAESHDCEPIEEFCGRAFAARWQGHALRLELSRPAKVALVDQTRKSEPLEPGGPFLPAVSAHADPAYGEGTRTLDAALRAPRHEAPPPRRGRSRPRSRGSCADDMKREHSPDTPARGPHRPRLAVDERHLGALRLPRQCLVTAKTPSTGGAKTCVRLAPARRTRVGAPARARHPHACGSRAEPVAVPGNGEPEVELVGSDRLRTIGGLARWTTTTC